MSPPSRRASERTLPPYAFVPGKHPHPTRDPRGHSFGRAPVPLAESFEWGVELYDHGYYWEAHEAWEPAWRAARDEREAALLAGLIQCAAACLKAKSGAREAALRLGARALGHLARADAETARARGFELGPFVERFAAWLAGGASNADAAPRIPLAHGPSPRE